MRYIGETPSWPFTIRRHGPSSPGATCSDVLNLQSWHSIKPLLDEVGVHHEY